MKRYWKIIVLSAVILCTFSIYYLQSVIAKGDQLELELVTVVDDEELEDSISINGDFYEKISVNGNFYSERNRSNFDLTSEGITYDNERGYFERINDVYNQPKFKQLVADYRGFMRGKENIESFYEDDTTLVYVGPYSQGFSETNKPFQLDVAILDKASGDKNSFSIDIPKESPYDFMTIAEVQLVGEEIHVFAMRDNSEIAIYTIDVNEEKLKGQESINKTSEQSNFMILNDYSDIRAKPFLVLEEYETELVELQDEEGYQEERASSALFSYHVETGEIQSIDMPEDWRIAPEDPFVERMDEAYYLIVEDIFMYFVYFSEEGLVMDKYNLETNEWEASGEIPLEPSIIDGLSNVFPNNNEKISFVSTTKKNGTQNRELFIVDILTEEIVYQGEIKVTSASKEMLIYDIDFYQLHIN